MTLREFCRNKREISIFRLTIIFLVVSILFSTSLYLKKVKLSFEEDLKNIEIVKAKIDRTYEIKRNIEKFKIPELKNKEIAVVQFIDTLNTKFPEAKFEISAERQEGAEFILPLSIRGDSSFKRFIELLNFLNQESYPICFFNSISLKGKESVLSFQINGELRLIK